MGTTITTTGNDLSVSDAGIEEVHVRLLNAEKDYHRYRTLLEQEAVTPQQFDNRAHQLRSPQGKLRTPPAATPVAPALVRQQQTQRLDQNDAAVAVAEAALDLARLNLSYTVITAPCDGSPRAVPCRRDSSCSPVRCSSRWWTTTTSG